MNSLRKVERSVAGHNLEQCSIELGTCEGQAVPDQIVLPRQAAEHKR
jgi:hypothetical protein